MSTSNVVTCFPPPLLSAPPSPLSLQYTHTVIVCSDRRALPRLLLTPSPVIMELIEALSKDLPYMPPLTRDTKHVIDLTPGVSLPSLPHHRIVPIKHTELDQHADELPLETKQ